MDIHKPCTSDGHFHKPCTSDGLFINHVLQMVWGKWLMKISMYFRWAFS